MPQGYSGWEFYWQRYPRIACPKCSKKTFVYRRLFDKRKCYSCGYVEGAILDNKVTVEDLK